MYICSGSGGGGDGDGSTRNARLFGHVLTTWLRESALRIGFLMASGGAYIRKLVYVATWLHANTCIIRDGSLQHWLYEPVAKPCVQLTKFFFAAYRYVVKFYCC